MSYDDTDDIKAMGEALADILPKVFANLTGPMSDLIKASTFATVDSLIDARKRMLEELWSTELADAVVITIINRNAEVAKKIGEAIQQASQNRKSS